VGRLTPFFSNDYSLLLRRDCCTFSNGEYVKAGLAELELWCCQAKEEVNCFCFNCNAFISSYGIILLGFTDIW